MPNKSKHFQGVVYSTDPQYQFLNAEEPAAESLPHQKQQLRVRIEKHHRGGKTVTIIDGFIGKEEDLRQLAKTLKQKCGTGGSVKDGLILIQGEMRAKVVNMLKELGYAAK